MSEAQKNKPDDVTYIEILNTLTKELKEKLKNAGGDKDVLEQLHEGNKEYLLLFLLAQQAELNFLREEIKKQTDNEVGMSNNVEQNTESETENEEKKKQYTLAEITKILNDMYWGMKWTTILIWFIRNNVRYLEKYYNWLLPYVESIDSYIPGFSKSWRNNRNNFDGMAGLVRAVRKVLNDKGNDETDKGVEENKVNVGMNNSDEQGNINDQQSKKADNNGQEK